MAIVLVEVIQTLTWLVALVLVEVIQTLTWLVAAVSRPSHRLMNWAFIMAVASWSRLERFLRKESEAKISKRWSLEAK